MDILDYFPIILTKDVNWINDMHILKEGSLVLLPQDAVLIKPHIPPVIKSEGK